VPNKAPTIATAKYPQSIEWTKWKNVELQKNMRLIIEIIKSVRSVQKTFNLKEKPSVLISCMNQSALHDLTSLESVILTLLRISSVTFTSKKCQPRYNEILNVINSTISVFVGSQENLEDEESNASRLREKAKKINAKLEKLVNHINSERYQKGCPEEVKTDDLALKIDLEKKLAEIDGNLMFIDRLINRRKQTPENFCQQNLYQITLFLD